jgi:ABC-type multidrug transport system fused ATPase/permease subunit
MGKRVKFRFMNGLSYGIVDLFVFSAQGLAFFVGIRFGLSEGQDLAGCVYAASLMGLMSNATLSGSSFLLLIQPSLAAASRVFDVLEMQGEADRPDTAVPDRSCSPALEFTGVSFTYPDGTKALDGVSLKIKNGEHIALVGSSGCGKSTLLKLIQALYEPTEGKILLFGAPASSLSLGTIRSLSAVVNQECTVFDDTIGVNIGYGKKGASEEDIIRAAGAAGIHGFIQSLPQGYDTPIGEGGRLSGGQRQRIAIARAVLKDAPPLILDEVTAALDSATEAELYKNLAPLMRAVTSITAAHRLSTVKNADRILVFEKGRIVEEGTHEALMALGGLYKNYYGAHTGGPPLAEQAPSNPDASNPGP